MKVVYIAHRLGSYPKTREIYRHRAGLWVLWAADQGVSPVADWIILSGHWDESPANRERALAMDVALVKRCDELWLCGDIISPGMITEREAALANNVVVKKMLTASGYPPGFSRTDAPLTIIQHELP